MPGADVPDIDAQRLFASIDLASRQKVVVAVSGGSDSLALLFLLKRYLDAGGAKVRPLAVTVDHRLRPEARDEARRVGEIANGIGIAYCTLTWDDPKPTTGVSAAAREARHRLLAGAAREADADLVLTGHTMDDQAETVGMRRQRGEGRGAAGIAPATLFDGRCWFARPLLGMRRATLRGFLTGIGQEWIDDPSNEDRHYERVRLRKALSGDEVEALARRAEAAATLRQALGRRAAELIAEHADMPAAGTLRLVPDFAEADRDAAIYALRILLAAAGAAEQLPDEARTAALFDRLKEKAVRATLSRCLVERRRGEIRIRRERRGGQVDALSSPTLGPWARYLPSFDLAPAAALARLVGAGEIPPPPLPEHNRPKA